MASGAESENAAVQVQVKMEQVPSPEAMDTNNNNINNLSKIIMPSATATDHSAPVTDNLHSNSHFHHHSGGGGGGGSFEQTSSAGAGGTRNMRYPHFNVKQNQPLSGVSPQHQTGGMEYSTHGRRSNEMLRGLMSPEFSSQTPLSPSGLIPNLSSGFLLEGGELGTPIGSGTFTPQAIDRMNRKRAFSNSPSTSSLDLNSLIRTSPSSLVNYITDSRASSAGSIGHLSPSLFINPTLQHPPQPHSKPLQVSLRNANYPIPNNPHVANGQRQGSEMVVEKGERMVQVKKELESSPPSLHGEMLDSGNTVKMGDYRDPFLGMCEVNIKMEPGMGNGSISLPPPPLISMGLATVQEEPGCIHASEEEDLMHSDQTDYSVMMNSNEYEFESKLGIIDNLGSDHEKQKRVYYSYPSVEEPHNNHCRWSECNKQCEDLDDLVRHVNTDHIYRDSRKEFICHWTGCVREKKPFKAQYMLLVHMRRHTGEKPHKCTVSLFVCLFVCLCSLLIVMLNWVPNGFSVVCGCSNY